MRRWLNLGTGLAVLTVILFLTAWNRGIALLYALFALVIATLVIGLLAPIWNRRGIEARRMHPATVHAGESLRIDLEVRSRSRLARHMIGIRDHVPCAAEDATEPFVFLRRLREPVQLHHEVPCTLRGAHHLGPLTVETAYPLGIARSRRPLPDTTSELLVYPATFEIAGFADESGVQRPSVGHNLASLAGGGDEFIGTREYRRGDSPRHIHWPSSARTGDLVVREFDFLTRNDYALILDLDHRAVAGHGRHSSLEYAVTIAASIARHALLAGHRVRLIGYGAEPLAVAPAAGTPHIGDCLDALARVQADGAVRYRRAVATALEALPTGTTVVLFETLLGNGQPEQPLELPSGRFHFVSVGFDRGSFERPGETRRARAGATARHGHAQYVVRHGDDLREVFDR